MENKTKRLKAIIMLLEAELEAASSRQIELIEEAIVAIKTTIIHSE